MASPPFGMEDQTDEDFFDKLVEDEIDAGISEPSLLIANNDDNLGSVVVNAEQSFPNLSIDEVDTVVDSLDNVDRAGAEAEAEAEGDCGEISGSNDVMVENFVNGGDVIGVVDTDCSVGGESESDSRISGSGANAGVEVKEVQWSALSGVTREVSYSDFFDQIGDDSANPFDEVAGDFGGFTVAASGSLDDASSTQVTSSSSYSLVHNGEDMQHSSSVVASGTLDAGSSDEVTCSSSYSLGQSGEDMQHALSTESQVPDQSSVQYWESLYPGWKYDANIGQWYQADGFASTVNNVEYNNISANAVNPVSYLQHTAQSVSGSMTEESTTSTSSYWNQAAYGNTEYPTHMLFDPQYPGWYYDTIVQEWRSLELYASSINQSTSFDQNQPLSYGQGEQVQNFYQLDQSVQWGNSGKDALNTVQHGKSEAFGSTENMQHGNGFISNGAASYRTDHRAGPALYEESLSNGQSRQVFGSVNDINRFQNVGVGETSFPNFSSADNTLQNNNHYKEFDQRLSATGFNGPNVLNFTQHPLQNDGLSYSSSVGRSPDGRPPHALVSFGFGGKLIVMKDQSNLHAQPAYASQDSARGAISILNVMEVAMPKNDGSEVGISGCDYFNILSQQSFSGPLASSNIGSKELNKWIDDRIANCNAPGVDYRKGEASKMLLSLLKIACQYYGKLRSAFGTDHGSKENDCPELALAKLFSSAKRNGVQFSAISQCLQNIPSEGQMQATAQEVQMLLVSGRKMEALQCAQNGHLWGPAIVIATLLGEQFYGETLKQMALHYFVDGSPLRTLSLLTAGQPAEVFSNSISNNPQYGVNAQSSGVGPGCMLDEWEENLAIISANRTKGDEQVITHLGDCLWRERDEVTAAHICYLVAEADIESYSETARLCLVGANHLKYPRTYASPEAIQRTELYEYAKVLGNSQCVLLPFQPYKLLYACMLAEVGKISDSLKYCQALLRSVKTSRSPEVDAWRQMVSSLEERIKIHQQGGYATNFAPGKVVGKLLNFFDNTAHRVVGGLPPPIPSTSHSNGQHIEHDNQSRGPRVSACQSTMAMSSLMTSVSAEGSDHMSVPSRSMSEPNFGRKPGKDESPKSSSSTPSDQVSLSGGSSRFGRFGSQIFQKTVGLVLRSRSDRQAKLGETNKFYYDEKLKRWVEEGAQPQAEEMPLAPPPISTAYMNGMLDHDKKVESVSAMVHANREPEYNHTNSNGKSAELPPIPSGSNHFSARGRMGVRSRYVDTFNKGSGTPANSFQPPSLVPALKPAAGNPKIFIPTPVIGGQETASTQSSPQTAVTDDYTTPPKSNDSFSSPQMFTPQSTIHRHPSMDKDMGRMMNSDNFLPTNSRRTLSWGGGLDQSNQTIKGESSASWPIMPHTSDFTDVVDDLQKVEL